MREFLNALAHDARNWLLAAGLWTVVALVAPVAEGCEEREDFVAHRFWIEYAWEHPELEDAAWGAEDAGLAPHEVMPPVEQEGVLYWAWRWLVERAQD